MRCATRRTNMTLAAKTPTTTPMARFEVATTTATVMTMMAVSLFGMRFNVEGLMECQSKVPTETITMMDTNTAIEMVPTRSPKTTVRISRKTPAKKVEIRVRALEDLTLIMVCQIIAQQPMATNKPETILAAPWPQLSRVLLEWVSVTSSTSVAVNKDSSRPTSAIARA